MVCNFVPPHPLIFYHSLCYGSRLVLVNVERVWNDLVHFRSSLALKAPAISGFNYYENQFPWKKNRLEIVKCFRKCTFGLGSLKRARNSIEAIKFVKCSVSLETRTLKKDWINVRRYFPSQIAKPFWAAIRPTGKKSITSSPHDDQLYLNLRNLACHSAYV